MEEEQLRNFNDRLNQWISSQGFWFMLKYSVGGTGMRGQIIHHVFGMLLRSLIFIVVIGIGIAAFLFMRTSSKQFSEDLASSIKSSIGAEEFESGGIAAERGVLSIKKIAATGKEGSIYSALVAKGGRCGMGVLDGLFGKWDPGIVSFSSLEMDLRAGFDSEASANSAAEYVFRVPGKVELNHFEFARANLRWGYSARTMGEILNSKLVCQRRNEGWRLEFTGGTFSQNWLKELEIVDMQVDITPELIKFNKATFKKGNGSVELVDVQVTPGVRPQVSGSMKIDGYAIESILPVEMNAYIEGGLTGLFQLSGSTNQSDGIGFEGDVVLSDTSMLTLRSKLPLLRALSDLDGNRNYTRLDFASGGFRMKTGGGTINMSEIDLVTKDAISLQGEMIGRKVTEQEKVQVLLNGVAPGQDAILYDDDGTADIESMDLLKKINDINLHKAASAGKTNSPFEPQQSTRAVSEGEESLTKQREETLKMRQLRQEMALKIAEKLWYEGSLVLSLPGDTFNRSKYLTKIYPADPATGRIPLKVPLNGLFYTLTAEQEELLYNQGQNE